MATQVWCNREPAVQRHIPARTSSYAQCRGFPELRATRAVGTAGGNRTCGPGQDWMARPDIPPHTVFARAPVRLGDTCSDTGGCRYFNRQTPTMAINNAIAKPPPRRMYVLMRTPKVGEAQFMDPFPNGAPGKAMLPALPFKSPCGHALGAWRHLLQGAARFPQRLSRIFQVFVLKPGSVRASGLHAR